MADQTTLTIICIDDDPDDIELICGGLKEIRPEVNVLSFNDGRKAMQQLFAMDALDQLPCLVIMDINMPYVSGREMVKEIKERKLFPGLQIAIFTTSSNPVDTSYFTNYDIPLFNKPTNAKELNIVLSKLVALC